MAVYNNFEDLPVWKEAIVLAVQIYKITKEEKFKRDYGLSEQIRRAAVSVSSNIAEGFERSSRKEFIRSLYIAKGSVSEVRSQVFLSKELGYLDGDFSEKLLGQTRSLSRQIGALISFLKKRNL
ncbi:MAG: four helix bundle protein [candidate division Zixibacteria bacterium]|nr:four helix bundle protein [candidate division Zixibacteria bacterium]